MIYLEFLGSRFNTDLESLGCLLSFGAHFDWDHLCNLGFQGSLGGTIEGEILLNHNGGVNIL